MPQKVLVLGGGISGLSLAWRLAEHGVNVELVESEDPAIGGLASTVKMGDYFLDFGPHFFFSENNQIIDKITGLFEEKMPRFKRSVKLYFHGRFLDYPLTARNVLLQLGFKDSLMCTASYFISQLKENITHWGKSKKREKNFEEWAIISFGNYLYRLFFQPYTEQFWGISCRELSPDSIPTNTKLSFFKTLKLLFVKDVVKSNLSLTERESRLPLYYPEGGTGAISEKIAQRIQNSNGKVHLGWKVNQVNIDGDGKFVVSTSSKDGKSKDFNASFVVSTIPLTDFTKMIKPRASQEALDSADRLSYLSLIVLYMVTDNRPLLDGSYLYHLDRPYSRIADMNKFLSTLSPENENMLAVEIPCHKDDAVWNSSKEELFDMCIGHLEKDGVLNKKEVKKIFMLKTPYAYPIYRYDYKHHLNRILNYIESIGNLEVFGRSGGYMYMDMDQCMLRAFDFADKIKDRLT